MLNNANVNFISWTCYKCCTCRVRWVTRSEAVWFCGWTCFSLNFNFFFFAKIECGLYFLDRFDVLMSKIIFKKWKNIIDMYFGTKSYLKSNHYHTAKHPPRTPLNATLCMVINFLYINWDVDFIYYSDFIINSPWSEIIIFYYYIIIKTITLVAIFISSLLVSFKSMEISSLASVCINIW